MLTRLTNPLKQVCYPKLSPQRPHFVLGHNFDVADWEDADHCVPLPLVPVRVHLALHVDDVALLEAELAVVLGLKN